MSKGKTPHVVRRTLADGTIKEYRYGSQKPQEAAEGTVAAVLTAWQRSVEWQVLRPNTQGNYVRYLREFFQAQKMVQIAEVRRRHLLTLRDHIAATRGPGAAAQFCAAASALFTWAIDREYLSVSPATRLATKLPRGELPTWRNDHAHTAMHRLPEPFRRAVVLAYYTGQRRGDLCRLRWSDYDGEMISLTQEKTGQPVEIPVLTPLRDELEAWKRDRSSVTILQFGGKPWSQNYLSKRLPVELKLLGLPPYGLHGLRKLCAVVLAEAGCSTHQIAAITGHETLAMVQHYTRAVSQRTLAYQATDKREGTLVPHEPPEKT